MQFYCKFLVEHFQPSDVCYYLTDYRCIRANRESNFLTDQHDKDKNKYAFTSGMFLEKMKTNGEMF
jgi:hypothetical protein